MRIKEILARIFFCDVDSVDNILIHIPVGLVNIAIGVFSGYMGILFGLGFIIYELNEQRMLSDKAYVDIQGWLWGLGILGIILLFAGI
jgi:hypothetical protein